MIEFKTKLIVTNPKFLTLKNKDRIIARSTIATSTKATEHFGPEYFPEWRIVKEEKGFIFREITMNYGIAGHAKTIRELVIKSARVENITIFLLCP